LLRVTSVEVSFRGIRAVRGVSLEVDAGEMVALIGPNGAGKSTLLNCISGIVAPSAGSIRLDDRECVGASPWAISRRGLLHVPEGRQILAEMTVLENLQLGLSALGSRQASYPLEQVFALFPVLQERRSQRAGSLSGGQQQMLAIGRALMGGPRLLLLDEPSLGLAPVAVQQVFATLRSLNETGLTIVLVEQNAKLALQSTHRAYVIEQGRIVHSGASRDLAEDSEIMAHYLGQSASVIKGTS
jgi:branched-chain amino acid transport system ATP-binding protein